jgi:hypothetical protein
VLQGLVYRFPTLGDAIREWNFLAVLFAGLALLTASGTAALAARPAGRWPRWVAPLTAVAAVAWSARQLWVWHHGAHFGFAWASAVEVAITAILAYLLLRQVRSRAAVAALLLLVWTDYKVYGTSRRFNAVPGAMDVQFRDDVRTGGPQWAGMAPSVYQILQQNRHYRVLFADAEWANEIRHYGMASPQGADSFVPVRYRTAVEQFVPFSTNRLFPFQFQNPEMMDAFGVKYVVSSKPIQHAALQPIAASGDWYFTVYEFAQARPIYRFEAGTAQHTTWTPEHRVFTVDSPAGGEFVLLENFAPGWEALVDGAPVPVERTRITFQRIQVPPGRHDVAFRYRSRALSAGAVISAFSLVAVALLALRRQPRLASGHATAVTILM